MYTTKAVNYVQARNGKVRAVCQCCGAQSRPGTPCSDGEPDLWNMARGWSEAPYPIDCEHSDGSRGSTYTCPKCNKRLYAGETLTLREYLRGGNE